ncbi:MAG: putative lipid II flippase FtsW [Chloroflexi bacterium]|nr:putative lipid II flippase FtsW [Chloroflexota bacterium]
MFQTTGNAFVKPPKAARSEARRRPVQLGLDMPLLLAVATLLIFGALMVYSASWDYSYFLYDNPTRMFLRQLAWMGLGLVGAAVLSVMDYHWWRKLAVPAMGVTLVSLVAVLFISDMRNGAVRTLTGGSIQPSELAKVITVIYLAVWLYARKDQLHDLQFGLFPLAGILGIMGGLIFVQPDLSAVLTIFLLGGMMFFLAGGDLRQIGLLIVVAALVGWVVVMVNRTGGERVASYLIGLKDPSHASYHVQRALEAFVNGGWFGVGIGNSQTKLLGLPVPPTDSIFAVVGEETGVFGAALLVGLYAVVLWRGLNIARRAPDELGTLMAAGLTVWLVVEALVNMAVMVNLLPFAGNALPFISAGGSNLMVSFFAVGVLLNISRQSARGDKKEEEDGRPYVAPIDLRWRNRRRRVSRPGGAASAQE